MLDWFLKHLDWSKKSTSGSELDNQIIIDFIHADCPQSANQAYWILESEVIKNHGLADVAHNVIICMLSSLPDCSDFVRDKCIELMYEIIASEPLLEGSVVLEQCVEEMYSSSWYLLNLSEKCDSNNLYLYTDLFCRLSILEKKFAIKAIHYLRKIESGNNIKISQISVLKNSISEIEELIKDQ